MTTFPYAVDGKDLWAWRQQAIAQAQASQIDATEVDWLLRGLCQVEALSLRLGTLAQQANVPSQVSFDELKSLWQKRVRDRIPIQHLVGATTWRDLTLKVSPAVLIPRPETEIIIDLAVSVATQSPLAAALKQGIWVDIGTGSGAIALGLATVFPDAKILAVDLSAAALAIAQQNASDNSLSDRIQFLQGSWFEPLEPWQGQLAGIVANPPYIPSAIVPTLEPEVAHHEPRLALDGGTDGLQAVRQLIKEAPNYLQPQGIWLVELMMGQTPIVMELLTQSQKYWNIHGYPDLAGIERFVAAFSSE